MALYKATANGNVQMTPEEEAEFEASRTPTANEIKERHNAPIKAQLAEIDRKRVRPLAEGDTQYLEILNSQAVALRAQLQ